MRRKKNIRKISLLLVAFICEVALVMPLSAQDTSSHNTRHQLEPVVVRRDKKPSPTLSQAPVQIVDNEKMEQSGALLLSDALKHMAGVTLRDYGGIGGMKTVSTRGLGSQFSTLAIDGVTVNDCQNGQVDLGRYMLGNSSYISLSNGQQDELLLSARATAAGSIINMESRKPFFYPGQKVHLRAGIEAGSFGLLSPSLAYEQRLGKKMSLSFWGNYTQSNGDYPFTLYYTASHNDSSSVENRSNSAMRLGTGDLTLFYYPSSKQTLSVKTHYVYGFHELPGPVLYYSQRGSEETHEQLFFTQAKYVSHQKKTGFQIIGKYQYTYDKYEDFHAQTISRYLMNEYSQQEEYLSASAYWKAFKGFTLSMSGDVAMASMESNLSRNSDVNRLTVLDVISIQYHTKSIDIKGNLLATIVDEEANDIPGTIKYRKVSPYIGAIISPLRLLGLTSDSTMQRDIRIRYFFKESYRVPNFNERYYFVMPLDSLRPECASQHNIGLTIPLYSKTGNDTIPGRSYSLTIDGYRNRVKDKIIAVPRQNMFIWSTMNLGIVDVTGLDISGLYDWHYKKWEVETTVTYSYQEALDHSDINNTKIYDNQIPYTPRHSGGATVYIKNPWINIGWNCMAVGKRYSQQENSDASMLPRYIDMGLTADHTFELPLGDLRIQAQVLNLLDEQYEIVRSYPMMGRNYRVKIVFEF